MRSYLLEGSPGTGKTCLARAAAYYVCHENLHIDDVFSMDIAADHKDIERFVDGPRCEYIQVHPSMGYEDIVYGASIQAAGALAVSYGEKRVKQLCDRARGRHELFCVIFDDISRANAGSLLGNLLYGMEYRNEAVDLGDGQVLSVPDNVVFIFTERAAAQSERLDYALRRRVDYVKGLYSDRRVLERYYSDAVGAAGTRIILEAYDAVCGYIDRSIDSEHRGRQEDYYPGHGMFIVDRVGTPYYILDNVRQRVIYQVFPHVRGLQAAGVINGDADGLFDSIKAIINTGISGLNSIASIQKILANAGTAIVPYSLADTKDYYASTIVPNRCVDNKGMLESVIDAIILNGVFPHDIALSALLMNTEIAAIPSKREEGVYGAYLVDSRQAADFYYESARRGRARAPHQYYSMNSGSVGRWAPARDVAAYRIMYADGAPPQTLLPLNGLRLHTFTTQNVCKADNPAEIYGALYRLTEHYLKAYAANISLIKGVQGEYWDLEGLIRLELRYLAELNGQLRTISAASQTERERARINYFGTKLMALRTLWNERDTEIIVDRGKFDALVSGDAAFTLDAYEDVFSCAPGMEKAIKLKGVVKMADLRDYQRIMESIGVRQMIFQGPPGTSKTFESKRFVLRQLNPAAAVLDGDFMAQEDISAALEAFKLTEADYSDPARSEKLATGGWDLVQFHPSYGYEDFIRGIEVKTSGGIPTYHTVNRILGKIAEFARMAERVNPEAPPRFYLVIDEINRANLAAVFGELIYGLEYRDSKVSTPYEVDDLASGTRTKDILLGKNLFIVGTMNTADESIDTVDYAIRRRFLFIDSPADRSVVIGCYRNVSGNDDENSIELLLFDGVQAIFDGDRYFNPDYQRSDVRLGHTYFLRKKAAGYADDMIERFVFQVIPILKEYVKDGILDSGEELIEIEHTVDEIYGEPDAAGRRGMMGDNIMVYAKEFGNKSRFGPIIDNAYIGAFVEELTARFGY